MLMPRRVRGCRREVSVPVGWRCGVVFYRKVRRAVRVLSGSDVGEGLVAMLLGAGGSGSHSWGEGGRSRELRWRGSFGRNGCHGKEGSYHVAFIREGDVYVCREGDRGEGRHRIVPEGLGSFESGRREWVCRGKDGEYGLRHLGFPAWV